MKKIITLLFFAGCVSTGFAQRHGRDDNHQSNGNGYQQPQNNGDGYSRSHDDEYSSHNGNGDGGYRGERNDKNYGYNHDRNERGYGDEHDRGRWGRDQWRGHEDRFQPSYNDHYYGRRHRHTFFQVRIW